MAGPMIQPTVEALLEQATSIAIFSTKPVC